MMNEIDKQRLRDAFATAIAAIPNPDDIVMGAVDEHGQPMTLRQFFTAVAQSERFYEDMGQAIACGQITIDQLVEKISGSQGISFTCPID